jgi:hypothetical protein
VKQTQHRPSPEAWCEQILAIRYRSPGVNRYGGDKLTPPGPDFSRISRRGAAFGTSPAQPSGAWPCWFPYDHYDASMCIRFASGVSRCLGRCVCNRVRQFHGDIWLEITDRQGVAFYRSNTANSASFEREQRRGRARLLT